ncbi:MULTISPECIES: hypothetical protein [Niastella]|uniref:DUF2007 domain-containing protein n=1 Tax=Niastella soli TaxID=2821487 RepID=A0ABS3YV99_9BACT|nr:hypothetical protein [Niastella soli]MBO9201798.1 hypothetical protein [Niastella soli]
MNRYATYEQFFTPEQAEPVLGVLKDNNIPFEFTSLSKAVDQLISGGGPDYAYEIKIPANQFETVNRLLRENIKINLTEIDPDYYLFAFDDKELIDVLKHPDEWGRLDFAIAREILETRGIQFSAEELDAFWNTKMEKLAQPSKAGNLGVWGGYTVSVLVCFIAVITGLVYWKSTKTLPNGNRYFVYDEETRKLGKNMFYLSLIIMAVVLTIVLARSYVLVSNNLIP